MSNSSQTYVGQPFIVKADGRMGTCIGVDLEPVRGQQGKLGPRVPPFPKRILLEMTHGVETFRKEELK